MYGQQPKVELLKRLGVPGVWDNWKRLNPWGEEMKVSHGVSTYNYAWAGWTSRLFSGNGSQEVDANERAIMRSKGIINFISENDKSWLFQKFNRKNLSFYNSQILDLLRSENTQTTSVHYKNTIERLSDDAIKYFCNSNYSVIDKTTLPPSGNKYDYWHPAPYYWPNPSSPDGLPYVRKDGQRVPGTRMFEAQSNQFDRTSLQRVFDETISLALAGHIFCNTDYIHKAIQLTRKWFG